MVLMFDLDQVEAFARPAKAPCSVAIRRQGVNLIPPSQNLRIPMAAAISNLATSSSPNSDSKHRPVSDTALRDCTNLKRDGWVNQPQDFTDVNIPDHDYWDGISRC